MANDVLGAAIAWTQSGVSVVPASADGTKRPRGEWKRYQHERADEDQVRAWFGGGHPGMGLVTGAISGNLEMFEFEGKAVDAGMVADFAERVTAAGYGYVWDRVREGYHEQTPSGGIHFFWKMADVVPDGNTKLAKSERGETLIETRGEGGFVVVAPSGGTVHHSGRSWTRVADSGEAGDVAILTADERDGLFAVARSFDRSARPAPVAFISDARGEREGTPGADFNERGSWEFLEELGFTAIYSRGAATYWTHPDSTRRDPNVVTGGAQGDYFFAWSLGASTAALTEEQSYSKFRTYALLVHGGDFSKAAAELASQGYGDQSWRAKRPELVSLGDIPAAVGESVPAALPERQPVPGLGDEQPVDRTDDANALHLVSLFGDVIRYSPEKGKWLTWTGQRWEWSGDGPIVEYARRIARALPEVGKDETEWKRKSLSKSSLFAVVSLAQSDPRIQVQIAELDAHPRELNTPGGIVDLVTGDIRPHDPARLHTKMAAYVPDMDAYSPEWERFISQTFHDEGTRTYAQRLFGYCLTGEVSEQVLPFAFGHGGNGKGVLLETVRGLMGDYSRKVSKKMLTGVGSDHPTIIAQLQGVRFAMVSEVNDEDRFDEGQVKELTGGDSLSARFMGKDFFDFEPTHKLMLMGNAQPDIRVGGDSFRRRLRLIPFTNTVPKEQRINDLDKMLRGDHGPAVLAWLVRGAVAYFADGLKESAEMVEATDEYMSSEDTIGQFVAERCELADAAATTVSEFRMKYEAWCEKNGLSHVTAKRLTMDLKARFGVEMKRTNTARRYLGIRIPDVL